MDRLGRLLGLLVLSGALFGLAVYHDAGADERVDHPTQREVIESYDTWVGRATTLNGVVRQTGAGGFTMEVFRSASLRPEPLLVDVGGTIPTVDTGWTVHAYGTLGPDRTMTAERVVVVNRGGSARAFKLGLSAVGALLVLVLFFRNWTVDVEELAFVPKRDG